MTPTLQTGDFIIVYKLGTLAVDDIVVFHVPERNTDFVKRCVALAGDTVEVRNKDLFVNNVFIPLPPQAVHGDTKTYPKQNSPRDFFGPYVVPNDHFFVMGDNRDDSFDSRYLGAIPNDQIVGLAVCTYWSWNNGLHAERIFCGL
jgi:signal peptidase I